ncbi:MAG: ferrous iron transport protein A [Syntrophaceae bacterium]|nr:ferrous iron transport protein A [Syntrophaceae bacterium]
MKIKILKDLKSGESGKITQIDGGHRMVSRLAALDIRPGSIIKKLSAGAMGGPVTVEVNRVQIAIGFGMAERILVAVEDSSP